MQNRTPSTSRATKRQYWRRHVTAQARTDLSQRAYCEQRGLKLANFTRWRRVLSEDHVLDATAPTDESAFMAVAIERSTHSASPAISVTLPNGLRIDGVEPSNVPTVVALARAL